MEVNKLTFIKTRGFSRSTIYIKVNSILMNPLFDLLHDYQRIVESCTQREWTDGIEGGLSYEIDTIEELEEFKENNNKLKELKYGTES